MQLLFYQKTNQLNVGKYTNIPWIILVIQSITGEFTQNDHKEEDFNYTLVGGFNPIEKSWSNWIIFPGRGENKKSLKPPTSTSMILRVHLNILNIFDIWYWKESPYL